MGGFGNVLFQILAFNVLSEKNGTVFFVKKLTEKNIFTKVLKWKIHQRLYNDLIDEKHFIKVTDVKTFFILICCFFSKLFKLKLKTAFFYNHKTQLNEFSSNNVFGYFQNKVFLSKNQKHIRELGQLLRSNYSFDKKFPIVVHYRKGDSNWALEFAEYYHTVREMLKNEVLPIIVVTDSISNAEDFFKEITNLKILSSKNALDDFKYLVSCNKLFCAPSTFSWWAAHSLLNKTEVIVPEFFMSNLGMYSESRINVIK